MLIFLILQTVLIVLTPPTVQPALSDIFGILLVVNAIQIILISLTVANVLILAIVHCVLIVGYY